MGHKADDMVIDDDRRQPAKAVQRRMAAAGIAQGENLAAIIHPNRFCHPCILAPDPR